MHKSLITLLLPIFLWPNLSAGESSRQGEAQTQNPDQVQITDQNSSLEAASKAANAAVDAANAAALAANAAANAASAAANAASQAVKATAQSIQQQNALRAAKADTAKTDVSNARPAQAPILAPADELLSRTGRPSQAMIKPSAPINTTVPTNITAPANSTTQLNATAPLNLQVTDAIFAPQTESVASVSNLSLPKLFGINLLPVGVTREIHNEYTNLDERGNVVSEMPAGIIPTLDMNGATQAAVSFSRDVRIAEQRVNQASSQSNQARALLLPNLSVRYARGRENSSPSSVIDPATGAVGDESDHTRTDRAVTFRQPLLDLPTIFDWKRRKQVIASREESRRGSQGDAWLSTVTAYLGLTSSRLLADLSLTYEGRLNELFDYVNKRTEAGASSSSDRERVRARTLAASSSRSQQESAHAAASVEFIRLTNLAPQQIKLPEREDLADIPNTVAEAIRISMANSPDVAVLRADLQAADIDRNVATARFSPRFDFELSKLGTTNAGGPTGLQDDTRAMFVMNWNLLNGGGDLQLAKEKLARLDEARYRLDDLQRRITQSMISQYAGLDATREQLVSAYRELSAISSAAAAMSEKMFAGNQSLLDLLDVYDRQYQARVRVVNLHIQEIDALSQIDRLLGQTAAGMRASTPVSESPVRGQLSPANSVSPKAAQPSVEVSPLSSAADSSIVITPLARPAE